MPRIRYIKPEFFTDADIGELKPLDRLFFAGLWCYADKAGRLVSRPRELKVKILPYDDYDATAGLSRLSTAEFVILYTVGGENYIQVRTWDAHQKPHHTERASVIPPVDNGCVTVQEREGMGMGMGTVNGDGDGKEKGEETTALKANAKKHVYPPEFETWWNAYPKQRRVEKLATLKAWKAARKQVSLTIGGHFGMSEDVLQDRVEAYAASTEGQGSFTPAPKRWLANGRYDDDPASWERNGDKPKQPELFKVPALPVTDGSDQV